MITANRTLHALTAATPNMIANPFRRRQSVLIPAGTPFTTTHPGKNGVQFTKRTQTVKLHMVSNGWVDLWNDAKRGIGFVNLPQVTWAGTGGYWVDVKVTPELAALNGAAPLTLPVLSDFDRDNLDAEPSFGPGYDNRHA